ncbi:hypothetical protein [Rhodococcus sp. MEB041]|uniref:hypothetical protein n=1 Tax=Rhodococcus sp. MEB041 TaxID=3040323 RepID=UPI00254AED8B|nr:hypothetical protein [Rhodococcus sp. MEB041]
MIDTPIHDHLRQTLGIDPRSEDGGSSRPPSGLLLEAMVDPRTDTVRSDSVATERGKQDRAFSSYCRAKERERRLAGERGQWSIDRPLTVARENAEMRRAIDDDVSVQEALTAALRACDDVPG